MQRRQGRRLEALRAIQRFLDVHAASLAHVSETGVRRKLDDTIAQLAHHVATQAGSELSGQGSTQKKRAVRRALLRDHVAPIARIAAAELTMTPELAPLRMP